MKKFKLLLMAVALFSFTAFYSCGGAATEEETPNTDATEQVEETPVEAPTEEVQTEEVQDSTKTDATEDQDFTKKEEGTVG